MTTATTPAAAPSDVALKSLLTVACEVANALVTGPKPLTAGSFVSLVPLLLQIVSNLDQLEEIPSELEELTDAEVEDLISTIGTTLSLGSGSKAEAVATAALGVVNAGLTLLTALKT